MPYPNPDRPHELVPLFGVAIQASLSRTLSLPSAANSPIADAYRSGRLPEVRPLIRDGRADEPLIRIGTTLGPFGRVTDATMTLNRGAINIRGITEEQAITRVSEDTYQATLDVIKAFNKETATAPLDRLRAEGASSISNRDVAPRRFINRVDVPFDLERTQARGQRGLREEINDASLFFRSRFGELKNRATAWQEIFVNNHPETTTRGRTRGLTNTVIRPAFIGPDGVAYPQREQEVIGTYRVVPPQVQIKTPEQVAAEADQRARASLVQERMRRRRASFEMAGIRLEEEDGTPSFVNPAFNDIAEEELETSFIAVQPGELASGGDVYVPESVQSETAFAIRQTMNTYGEGIADLTTPYLRTSALLRSLQDERDSRRAMLDGVEGAAASGASIPEAVLEGVSIDFHGIENQIRMLQDRLATLENDGSRLPSEVEQPPEE